MALNLIEEMEKSTQRVVFLVKQCSSTLFTKKPATDKWSIAEVIEHLNITDRTANLALMRTTGPVNETELSISTHKIESMLNANKTWIAPSAAEPKGKFVTREEAIAAFEAARNKIKDFASKNDMTYSASGFEHPRLGFLTRNQWLQFLAWHANHHALQIERNLNELNV